MTPPTRVMMSFPARSAPLNPYLAQLVDGLSDTVEVTFFDWGTALAVDYDLVHLHWPEDLLRGADAVHSAARRAAVALWLRRLRHRRVAVVRTVHNTEPHEPPSSATRRSLRRIDTATHEWITLNPQTQTPDPQHTTTIPHGDYRGWYRGFPAEQKVPGRLLFFGLLRPYKNVPALLSAFAAVPSPEFSLHVVGKPKADVAAQVRRSAQDDPRIVLRLGRAEDRDLAREVGQAELVVLPYREMHNSGAALLALSLATPVLVPDNPVTRALAREVGEGWVQTFRGDITAGALTEALRHVRRIPAGSRPDLSARDWMTAVGSHLAVYEAAMGRARGGR